MDHVHQLLEGDVVSAAPQKDHVHTVPRWCGAPTSLPHGPLLLEEFVSGETEPGDLTFDGLVDAAGRVHEVGVAVMDVEGTVYQGATVGPGVVPEPLSETVARFGRAVGERIAASGYRGWFDVDFVTGSDGRPAPTEINLRMTGPSVAFMVKARLDEIRGGDHLVRTVDHVPLGARLPGPELSVFLRETTRRCGGIDAVLLPSGMQKGRLHHRIRCGAAPAVRCRFRSGEGPAPRPGYFLSSRSWVFARMSSVASPRIVSVVRRRSTSSAVSAHSVSRA